MASVLTKRAKPNPAPPKGTEQHPSISNSDGRSVMKGSVFMILLAIQFGTQPVLTKRFTDATTPRVTIVGLTEIMKLVSGLLLLYFDGDLGTSLKTWTLSSSISVALVPSFLYAFQNILIQTAYRNLEPLVFNLINQTKLLWGAVFLFLLLNKRQTKGQIFALGLIFVASIFLSMPSVPLNGLLSLKLHLFVSGWDFSNLSEVLVSGVAPAFVASLASGMATALSEKALQKLNRNSFFYSIELAVGSLLALPFWAYFTEYEVIVEKGLLAGVTLTSLLPMITNASGGIGVGLVTKHLGAMMKGFALILGVLFTAVMQVILQISPITWNTLFSLPLIIFGIYLHASYNPLPPVAVKDSKARLNVTAAAAAKDSKKE